jgi:hypothetical protein
MDVYFRLPEGQKVTFGQENRLGIERRTPMNPDAKFRVGASTERHEPIRFAGSDLGAQRHICAFFHSSDEAYRVMLPFIKDGFDCGHKSFHVIDPKLATNICSGWHPAESMWPRQNKAANSSFATGVIRICAMAVSIRIE